MTIYEAYQYLQIQLRNIYDEREAANISDLILEHITKKNKTERRLNKSATLSSAQKNQLKQYATELLQHKPVQYVLREAWFAGMKLYVDENVLIPRPETEELVEWVVEEVDSWQMTVGRNSQFSILDVGTGSGCIAIALKKRLPNIEIHALDISEKALEIAKRNAATQNTFIHFFHCDILNEEDGKLVPQIDIIASNPPYIKQSEALTMQQNVIAWEPHTALFVRDEDSLLFYKKIIAFSKHNLKPEGKIFFEINESCSEEINELLKNEGYKNIELRKDMQGKSRMIKAFH